jgi:2-oxoglutarate ferredoxin oxidoreductase subunit beta
LHTKDWFAGKDRVGRQPRVYEVEKEGYDPLIPEGADEATVFSKTTQCIRKAQEWGDRIPLGVFLENRMFTTFEQRTAARVPSYYSAPPARRIIADDRARPTADLRSFFDELAIT